MKILYAFVVYKSPEVVKKTISKLNGMDSLFYIHVDANSSADFSLLEGMENVHFVRKRYPTPWAGMGIIYAILAILDEASDKNWDYICLMSEADYPVKSPGYISDFLENSVKDHIRCVPLPDDNPLNIDGMHWYEGGRRRLECYAYRLTGKLISTIEPRNFSKNNIRELGRVLKYAPSKLWGALKIWSVYPPRRHPSDLIPCGGDLWFFLRHETTRKILEYVNQHPEYLQYCKDSVCIDELFFPTLVYNLVPHDSISDDILRFISWSKEDACSPAYLTGESRPLLSYCVKEPNILIVRKIYDVNTCRMVDQLIGSSNFYE